VKTELGELKIRVFTYLHYLNQSGLDPTYTNAFGDTSNVQEREDLQLNKVQITTFGWILSPKLRYVAYVWSSNTSLGQLSQVVVAGNLTYTFNPHLTVGAGINALPGVRTTEGTFRHWLGVDSHQIATSTSGPPTPRESGPGGASSRIRPRRAVTCQTYDQSRARSCDEVHKVSTRVMGSIAGFWSSSNKAIVHSSASGSARVGLRCR
jgi:hypothetical protein